MANCCTLIDSWLLVSNYILRYDNTSIISNEALVSLTLFIASSKREESDTVKKLIVSILNRSRIAGVMDQA